MKYVLGIDVGTSASKVVLFDSSFLLLASHSGEYPLYQPQNGWAEQDPRDWWTAVRNAVRAISAEIGFTQEDEVTIGFSGQMHGLVMLDCDGAVLRNSIIWCDQRTGRECEEITEKVGKDNLIRITANPALTGFTASKILWVKNHEPECFAKCAHILLPKDYIRYMLTGDFATDVADASGMQLLDVPNRCWSKEVLQKLGISAELLPKLYESAERTGTVKDSVAEELGLPKGTAVAAGAGDCASAAVGTGIVEDGLAMTTLGSSGVVFTHSSRVRIDPQGRVHTFCAAVPGEWHVMGVTQGCGLSVKWLRDTICRDYAQKSELTKIPAYRLMDDDAESVPVGSEKLIYLPYLMGERTPHLNPDARGVFFGLSAIHEQKHLIRSVMEGVSFSLYDCFNVIASMGLSVEEMIVCGGGSRSPFWRKMLADVYGLPVKTLVSSEGSALGAAILASVAGGMYPSVLAACQQIRKVDQSCEPDQNAHAAYQPYYRLYQELYRNLKDSFTKLAQL